MKLEVERYELRIIPESEVDKAYIEEVLGLKEDGAWVKLVRRNAAGLACIAYLETKRRDSGS